MKQIVIGGGGGGGSEPKGHASPEKICIFLYFVFSSMFPETNLDQSCKVSACARNK